MANGTHNKRSLAAIQAEISLLEGHLRELSARIARLSALVQDATTEVSRIHRRLPALKAWRTMKQRSQEPLPDTTIPFPPPEDMTHE